MLIFRYLAQENLGIELSIVISTYSGVFLLANSGIANPAGIDEKAIYYEGNIGQKNEQNSG